MRVSLLAWIPILVACAGPVTVVAPAAVPEPRSTRYHLGDFVVYRYAGSFSQASVTMREQITAQEGNHLRIDVTLTRASDERRWVQVVTDTPENRKANVVDALYEWRDGKLVRLDNVENRDLARLYDWVLVEPDGHATDVKSERCKQTIAGVTYTCSCRSGRNTIKGAPVTFCESECADFVWTHGPTFFRDVSTSTDVLRAEIVDVGHDANAKPEPLTLEP